MIKSRSVFIIMNLLITFSLGFSMTGCKSEVGVLEDMPYQQDLRAILNLNSSSNTIYTSPGRSLYLGSLCPAETQHSIDIFPKEPVYVWTIFFEGDIVGEITHDKFVPVREGGGGWPWIDEIKYEFLSEGKYEFRVDLYDNSEYETLKNMAPRHGTLTITVYCERFRINLTATPTGETREYTFTATVENPRLIGLHDEPEWKFIVWGDPEQPCEGPYDTGKTEIINEEDPGSGKFLGVSEATHQFREDRKFCIIFSIIDKDTLNAVASTDMPLDVKGVALVIRVPEQPLRVGQEYTFIARNDYPENLPAEPYYTWDFDDDSGITIPFSNEATHLYTEEGNYTVTVTLHDSDATEAAILATATVEVQVEASADHLIALHQMKNFSIDFAVQHDYVEGMSGVFWWDWDSYGEVVWDGVNGSMEWEQDGHSERMTCRVSEDGTMIEQLIIRHEFGDTEWYELEIQNLPFWEDTMPDRFIVEVDAEDVPTYVVYFNTYRTAGYQWTDDARLYVRFLQE